MDSENWEWLRNGSLVWEGFTAGQTWQKHAEARWLSGSVWLISHQNWHLVSLIDIIQLTMLHDVARLHCVLVCVCHKKRSKSVMGKQSLQFSDVALRPQTFKDCCVRMCPDVRRDCPDCPPANVVKPDFYKFILILHTHFVLRFPFLRECAE